MIMNFELMKILNHNQGSFRGCLVGTPNENYFIYENFLMPFTNVYSQNFTLKYRGRYVFQKKKKKSFIFIVQNTMQEGVVNLTRNNVLR